MSRVSREKKYDSRDLRRCRSNRSGSDRNKNIIATFCLLAVLAFDFVEGGEVGVQGGLNPLTSSDCDLCKYLVERGNTNEIMHAACKVVQANDEVVDAEWKLHSSAMGHSFMSRL